MCITVYTCHVMIKTVTVLILTVLFLYQRIYLSNRRFRMSGSRTESRPDSTVRQFETKFGIAGCTRSNPRHLILYYFLYLCANI
jgi:hypothetical protein